MLKMTLVAAAAALLATAASAQSIHIKTTGMSPAELKAAVTKAAVRLCARETTGSSFPIDAQNACVAKSVRDALAQPAALHLTAYYAQR